MRILRAGWALAVLAQVAGAQGLTWSDIQARFLARNPSLAAGALNIEEAKANTVTAGLRPNPDFGVGIDQYQLFPGGGPFRPVSNIQFTPTISQLWERRNKRPLRVESAQLAAQQTETDQLDLRRTMLFSLRDAFNRILTAKSLLALAEDNLQYYDKVVSINRDRLTAGDIARVDFQRVELQHVQVESDLETARVNLRTAKIDLMTLLNEHTSAERFDVNGKFDFSDVLPGLEGLEASALAQRPDLRSAETAIKKAETDHRLAIANGSWDPTIGGEYLWNPQVLNTVGVSLSVPLRVFDQNQGEKARTAVEITRTQKLRDSITNSVLHDVDGAYSQLLSVRNLLVAYRSKYIQESTDIRDVVSLSYQNGAASLLDFLDAQKSYRDTQQAYRNLIGSYLTAVAQLNTAVGLEVIP